MKQSITPKAKWQNTSGTNSLQNPLQLLMEKRKVINQFSKLTSLASQTPENNPVQFFSLHNYTAPDTIVQRKINYKKFGTKELFTKQLKALYPGNEKAHNEIDGWIEEYEKADFTIHSGTLYEHIKEHLLKSGFVPILAPVLKNRYGKKHGPLLPVKTDRTTDADQDSVLSTFNFGSVTLGRLTAITLNEQITFHDRSQSKDEHAEDGLILQIQAQIDAQQITPENTRLNLTINNFFCDKHSTEKTDKAHNCLDKFITFHQKHRFLAFHVYFQNTYGEKEKMPDAIQKLKDAGIQVTAFLSPQGYKRKKRPKSEPKAKTLYVNDKLDPTSDNEEEEEPIVTEDQTQATEEESDTDSDEKPVGKPPKKKQRNERSIK